MAQHVITRLIDDLDQESEATGTLAFGLDGSQFEMDLIDTHAAELRDAFAPYVQAARRGRRDDPHTDRVPEAHRCDRLGGARPGRRPRLGT